MRLSGRTATKRRGVAAVEFGVLLPVMLVLLLGVWEVGRMVEVQQLLTNAAREGGRQASTGTKSSSQVKDVVVRYLQQNGIPKVTTSDVSVLSMPAGTPVEPNTGLQLDHYQVKVTISVDSVRWALLNQITSLKSLTGTADWYSMKDIPLDVDYSIPLQ